MVKLIPALKGRGSPETIGRQKQNKESYQCEECGFEYAEKEWAEKCEAWCKEHKSCNIEITAHGMLPEDESKKTISKTQNE